MWKIGRWDGRERCDLVKNAGPLPDLEKIVLRKRVSRLPGLKNAGQVVLPRNRGRCLDPARNGGRPVLPVSDGQEQLLSPARNLGRERRPKSGRNRIGPEKRTGLP